MVERPMLQLPRSKKIDIGFQDVRYMVDLGKDGIKQVLKGVSGNFKSGELTAIMGPSGAGKTSLLNILTGFQTIGTEGTIKCNNIAHRKGALHYRKQSCYILQDDHLSPFFTVNEIMTIAANLKISSTVSKKAKRFLVEDILDSLSLSLTKETRCNRLSGGQKKRLSIALELIDNPPVMFLDEPTTGLDSSSSFQCIKMLKALARGGRTIICTIHQPSASIYELFDHVYAMADGQCIYQGASSNTVAYLSSAGFNCPQYHNPADYLLEVANGEHGPSTELLAKAVEQNDWREPVENNEKCEVQEKQEISLVYYKDDVENIDDILNNNTPPSELNRFCTLVKRSFLQMYRDWTTLHLRIALHLTVGIFLGITYYNYGQDAAKTIQNFGFLIISIVYLIYTSLMPAVLKFPSELAVLKKERFNNWYNLKTYYVAFLVADTPIQIIFSILYTTTSYALSGQPFEWNRYFMVQFILTLVTLVASSFGILLGTLVNPINGTFLGAILTAFMLCLGGFLIFFTHMSSVMYILTYFSYISYALEGMVEAVYGLNRSPLMCPEDADYCHYKFPSAILKEIGMDKGNYWVDVGFLIGNFLLFRMVAFCTLRRKLATT